MRLAVVLVVVLALAGCKKKQDDKPGDPGTARIPTPDAAEAKAVVIHHSEQAADALAHSGLVAELTKLGLAVTYQVDEAVKDDVAIFAGAKELGRIDLHALLDAPDKSSPELLDVVKAHFHL